MAMVDPSGVMLMSLLEEEDEDTDYEEEKIDPSEVPDLSDSDNTDDLDHEGTNDSHDLGRSSPEQPDDYEGSDDSEREPDKDDTKGYNGEHKNVLPGLITPGDLGIEDQSDSEFDDDLDDENPSEEDEHFKGTEFYNKYFDKTRNAPGSTKVEEHELKCPKLSTGEPCKVHKTEDDLKIVSFMCPLIATPKHCVHQEHSKLDHEPVQCTDEEHIHEPE